MRYLELISEKWHATFDLDGTQLEVFKDPSARDLAKMFREYGAHGGAGKGLCMRALLTTDGSIYVWDAYFATHSDVENFMSSYPFAGGYLYLHPEYVFFNDMHYFANDEGEYDEQYAYRPVVRGFYEKTINNRSLNAYYRGQPKIVGVDSQPMTSEIPTDKEFEITPQFIERFVAPRSKIAESMERFPKASARIVYGEDGEEADVFVRPSEGTVMKCIGGQDARAIIYGDGTLVVWHQIDMFHQDVYDHPETSRGSDFELLKLYPPGRFPVTVKGDTEEPVPFTDERFLAVLRGNRTLRKIYGENFPVETENWW